MMGLLSIQIGTMDEMINRFKKYQDSRPTKQPGITENRPWDGRPS